MKKPNEDTKMVRLSGLHIEGKYSSSKQSDGGFTIECVQIMQGQNRRTFCRKKKHTDPPNKKIC